MWIRLLPLLSLSLTTAIPASSGLIPPIEPWVPMVQPPPSCGMPVAIAAALPRPDPDAVDEPADPASGERVVLVNRAPHPVDLDAWSLRSGRRKVVLAPLILGPGAGLTLDADQLGSVRLRNDNGAVALFDPCDTLRDAVEWGRTEPGEWLAFADSAARPGAEADSPHERPRTGRNIHDPAAWTRSGYAPALRAAPMVAAVARTRPAPDPHDQGPSARIRLVHHTHDAILAGSD